MITKRPIQSSADPKDHRPWFRFTIDEQQQQASFTEASGPVKKAKHTVPLKCKKGREDAVHVLLLTLEGEYIFVPEDELSGDYYAHLAWYYPDTDTWHILDFQENGHGND